MVVSVNIRWNQIRQIFDISASPVFVGRPTAGNEDFFNDVELRISPRLQIGREIIPEQPMIQKGFVFLISEIRENHLVKKCPILMTDKETEFMASVL